jgi:hypothetical protein
LIGFPLRAACALPDPKPDGFRSAPSSRGQNQAIVSILQEHPMTKTKQVARLTREEYAQRLAAGQLFRGAGLYEDQHAPRGTEFVIVMLTSKQTAYKRRIK